MPHSTSFSFQGQGDGEIPLGLVISGTNRGCVCVPGIYILKIHTNTLHYLRDICTGIYTPGDEKIYVYNEGGCFV